MKKFLLLSLLHFVSQLASAQVGIGNTSPKAQLDITASNATTPSAEDGILIPRINTFPGINPTAPQNGMLVFLTTASGLNLPGFYYWSNLLSAWVGISSGNKSWDISGNSVATSGVHFVGTTNNQDVDFRSNNIIKMRLSQKGQLEFLNTGKSVFLGEQAGENDDLSNNSNVFVGYKSGFGNISGFSNTAIGYQSLLSNTTGASNVAIGYFALLNNTTGLSNTGLGTNSLMNNTIGGSNVGVGTNALLLNTIGAANTAVGHNSMAGNTAGYSNTAIGFSALYNNSSGYFNIAVGGSALLNNTTGYFNTASGFTALMNNTTGTSNTALGTSALYDNITGANNTAIGVSSLLSNTTGLSNTAIGIYALRNNTTGGGNTASGRGALQKNSVGIYNTSSGMFSLSENLTGRDNTANGFYALFNNISGNNNVGVGSQTLGLNISGSNNTAVGYASGPATGILNNTTAVGNLATVNVSNKIRLGNAAITLVEGQVSFSNPSDARFKNNVKNNVPGLDFIMKLNPVTYNFDTKKFDAHLMQNMPDSIKNAKMGNNYSKSSSIIHSGFLAQDVEKAANEIGYDFDGLHIPEVNNPTDNYSVAYSQFIMPIVKSIQEQQQTITSQKFEIAKLESENLQLKAELSQQKKVLEAIGDRLNKLEKQ